ncbi:hypothetical protein H6F89_27135 [Cyanobacteria bacterium FACHB-63]|nr:hypothetical protein [Cyanobacteria bacterium FACHB-63]
MARKNKNITDQQLAVLRAIIAGQTFDEIQESTGVPVRTSKRWKSQFAGLLAEHDDAISSLLLEARSESAALILSALDELSRLMRTADQISDKLATIDRIFNAYRILNPPAPVGSVTVQQPESSTPGQVVVMLPDNNRDKKI